MASSSQVPPRQEDDHQLCATIDAVAVRLRELAGGAGGADSARGRRPIHASPHLPDMGPWHGLLRHALLPQHLLRVPQGAAGDHGRVSADRRAAPRPPHGGAPPLQGLLLRHRLRVHPQPGTVQREGARAHHHLRQRRCRLRLCHQHRHRAPRLLHHGDHLLRLPPHRPHQPGDGFWLGGHIPVISGGAGGDVVAVQPRAGYLLQMLTSLSWICWTFPNSVVAQQLGSGMHGLGIGAIGVDWSSISSYLGSPLASPWFATANVAAGFVIYMYIITPVTYWFNIYKAQNFPIISDGLFTVTGRKYNISTIIDSQFHFDTNAYEKNGPLYISTFFAVSYGLGFACLTATLVHVILFHGSEIWQLSKSAIQEKKVDIHTKLMRRYRQVPEWWFICILVASIAITMFTCEYYIEQLQLPWWGVLLACALAIFYTLPIGIITATTNQTPGLNIITEYIMGYLYPGRPVANMCFKVYGYIGPRQALAFLQDFKPGHYMKIPPRTMFMAQVVGTIIAASVYLGTA